MQHCARENFLHFYCTERMSSQRVIQNGDTRRALTFCGLEIAWLWVLTWFRASVSCRAHKNNWFAHFSPLWSSACCGPRRKKGELSHLNQPHTLAAHGGIKQIYVCFRLISGALQKQKGTDCHAACFTAADLAYNNNTEHRYIYNRSETP